MLFECQYSHFPPLRDLFHTPNHLVLVTNEGIKRKFLLSTTLGSTYSWGSVINVSRGGAGSRQPGAHNLLCCCVEEGGEEAFSPAEERGDKVGQ